MAQGGEPGSFWGQTPCTLYLIFEGWLAAAEERITVAWMTANWIRADKLPRLETVLRSMRGEDAAAPGAVNVTPEEMLAYFQALEARGVPVTIRKVEEVDDA